jgi:hypothetical protein
MDAHGRQRRDILAAGAAAGAALIAWKAKPRTKSTVALLRKSGAMTGDELVHTMPDQFNMLRDAILELYDALP